MLFYIDHKCATQPGFRKTFLVFTLIFHQSTASGQSSLYSYNRWTFILGATSKSNHD
jgi:hypothetical protein